MCNYLLKTGKVCPNAKTKDRCARHACFDKYQPHMTNPILAEDIIEKFLVMPPNDEEVDCPCGTTNETLELCPSL